jgi:indole-3-pyruvate monooxygenase
LDAYAALLGSENIRYNLVVKQAIFDDNTKLWTVTAESLVTQEKLMFSTTFFVVATGENVVPKVPKFKGEETFKGKIIHSAVYKNGRDFAGQRVLVVGYGNSGGEISMDLV